MSTPQAPPPSGKVTPGSAERAGRVFRSPSNGRPPPSASSTSSPEPSQQQGKVPGSADRAVTRSYRSPFASPPQATGSNDRQQLLRKTPSRQSMTSLDEEEAGQKKGGGGSSEMEKGDPKTLAVSFIAMVVVGVGNRIFGKLETYPM